MRAANMQALTNDLKNRYPGVVIYGIGDAAHRAETSDHNEDDTAGVRTEQTDGDNVPEHRAIDVMLSGTFTHDEADRLVAKMVVDGPSRDRLYYVIWNHHIWRHSAGWTKEDYDGRNPHTDHVHFDGRASDDENSAGWPIVYAASGSGPTPSTPAPVREELKRGSTGPNVTWLQQFLRNVFPAYRDSVSVQRGHLISVDGNFGLQTDAWVREFQHRTGLTEDGIVGPKTTSKLREFGYQH